MHSGVSQQLRPYARGLGQHIRVQVLVDGLIASALNGR
jgi:hypothetical protein